MTRHDEGRFEGGGGLALYCQRWSPDAPPRAAVVLVHGVCEHSGRYGNVVRPLTDAGYVIYAYDLRGHGLSPGPRVHIDAWDEYRGDLRLFVNLVTAQEPALPIVLYGHSMGSLIVLDHLLLGALETRAAVVSSVPIEPAGVGRPHQVALARLLSGVVPRLTVDLDLDPADLSSDPTVRRAYAEDPAVTCRASLRWGAESLAAVARVKRGIARIRTPLLVVHGEADRLNRLAGAVWLHREVSSPDKKLLTYAGVRHEPHNDVGHERIMADVVVWLDRVSAEQARR